MTFRFFSFVLCLALLLPCAAARQAQGVQGLANPGFEAAPPQEEWEVSVYGAQPKLTRDTQIFHEGRSALRIQADAPSDTALGQEIRLQPGHTYRLRGWVKTQGLDPHNASVYGTFQVQKPGGKGVLASGVSHGGDTEWTEVSVPFLTPPDGRVRICVFFVGFGRGTGTAWFDALRIEEVNLTMSPITVTRDPLCPGEISPFQYGQFIEYLCTLVPGMWSEKLYDGSFEGLSPYKFVYLKGTDFKEKPWYPSGATNRAEYSLDQTTKVSGDVSQKIAVTDGAPCTVGISQDGIALEHGVACRFTCYLQQEGVVGPVRVQLHQEGRILATAAFHPSGEWHKVEARLSPSETTANATLTIDYRGPGTLHLDNASLMPEDNIGGWRRNVVETVRALKPGIIRFGGSALDDSNLGEFQWTDTIGDPDHRRPFRAWGGLQPTGPGLEEIVQFCYSVGAEPLICVRVTGTAPQTAADQVQYFNGAVDTPFGAMRAKNGHPAPYHIKYWQVGNERSGPTYEERLPIFCTAMRQADPTIKLLSSYPTVGVLRQAGNRPLKLASDLGSEIGPDISATLSADGKTVTLFAINTSGQEIARPLDLSAFGAHGQEIEVQTLTDKKHAGEPDVSNSFADPERIAPTHSVFHVPSAHFTYRFPAYSLTVLRWKVVAP